MGNGLCPKCATAAEVIERVQANIRRRSKPERSAWWMGKAKAYGRQRQENLPLAGQDAALPVGDRQ